jgi:ATP-dependent Clp protease ATP-binding subunit ClpB
MLTKEDLRKIVDIQLNYLRERLEGQKVKVEFTDGARERIMDEGYDPVFGARPLKRTIQQRIENPLAAELLMGKFLEGDTVKVDANAHMFTFQKV